MKLHQYLTLNRAWSVLDRGQIIASTLADFNDPFEGHFTFPDQIDIDSIRREIANSAPDPEDLQKIIQDRPDLNSLDKIRDAINRRLDSLEAAGERKASTFMMNPTLEQNQALARSVKIRFCCFTSSELVAPKDEILLWSYYASGHAGIRIHFDLDEDGDSHKILNVIYQGKRPSVDPRPAPGERAFSIVGHEYFEVARTKSDAWKHEHEYRMYVAEDSCTREFSDSGKELFFYKFNNTQLVGVDFGIMFPKHMIKGMAKLISERYPNAIIRQASCHDSEFLIDYRKV